MKLRLGQVLAAFGTVLAVAGGRWAWEAAVHPPPAQGEVDWIAPAMAGFAALVAFIWAVWLFHGHLNSIGQEHDSGKRRSWPLKVDRVYSVLCCTFGGIASLLFLSKSFIPLLYSLLAGPPLLFANFVPAVGGFRLVSGQRGGDFAICVLFLLYYHLLAAPGYVCMSRTPNGHDKTRSTFLTAQWALVIVHILLVALFAWLMQA